MSEKNENIMKSALDAFNAGKAKECMEFCDQIFLENPDSANARALKGASLLLDFSLEDAANLASEAVDVWELIKDDAQIADEYKNAVSLTAFEFRNVWYKTAKKSYKKIDKNSQASKEEKSSASNWFAGQKKAITDFMKILAYKPWLQNYPTFIQCTINLANKQIASLKNVKFARILVKANKGKDGEIGTLTKKLRNVLIRIMILCGVKWAIILFAAYMFIYSVADVLF